MCEKAPAHNTVNVYVNVISSESFNFLIQIDDIRFLKRRFNKLTMDKSLKMWRFHLKVALTFTHRDSDEFVYRLLE